MWQACSPGHSQETGSGRCRHFPRPGCPFPASQPWLLTPVSVPQGKNKVRRVKTIYDCQADNDDELTFIEGEVIVVTGEEDQEWWVRAHRRPSWACSAPLHPRPALPAGSSSGPGVPPASVPASLCWGFLSLSHLLTHSCGAWKRGQESSG